MSMNGRLLSLALAVVSLIGMLAVASRGDAAPAIFNVREYGAVGDGTTDDLPALRRAVLAMQRAGGGQLYFPTGTYRVTDRLYFGGDNFQCLRIFGDGDASIVTADTRSTDVFFLEATSGAEIDHLRFVGPRVFNKHSNHAHAVTLLRAQNSRVHDCSFFGVGVPLHEATATAGTFFTNNRVQDWGGVAYFVEGHARIENNLFEQTDPGEPFSPTGSSHALYIHSGNDEVVVRGNTFRGVRYYAIQLWGRDERTVTQNVMIEGNTFEKNADDIIVFSEANTVEYQHIRVRGNTFRDTEGWSVSMLKGTDLEVADNRFIDIRGSYAIQMGSHDSAGFVRNSRVVDNTILYTQPRPTQGIRVETVLTEDVEVRNNWIMMYGRGAIFVHRANRVTIADNVIWMGPQVGESDFAHGINLNEFATNVTITGNEVYGTDTRLARGVYSLSNPNLTSGTVTGNRFFGAPLEAGPLVIGENVVAGLTGQPVILFALEDEGSGKRSRSGTKTVRVVIEGGEDAAAWLLSETQVRMPDPADPLWQTTKPQTLQLSEGEGVKRIVLWRKLADGTVSNRPEVAVIEFNRTQDTTVQPEGGAPAP
jgi:hypothetical protein